MIECKRKGALFVSPAQVYEAVAETLLPSTALLAALLDWSDGSVVPSTHRGKRCHLCGSPDTQTGPAHAAHSFSQFVGTGPRQHQAAQSGARGQLGLGDRPGKFYSAGHV